MMQTEEEDFFFHLSCEASRHYICGLVATEGVRDFRDCVDLGDEGDSGNQYNHNNQFLSFGECFEDGSVS